MSGIALARAAQRYVGTPWREQGRSPTGLDCVGLVICAARDVGVDLDPDNAFTRHTPPLRLMRVMAKHFRRVPVVTLRAGDVVFGGDRVVNVAITSEDGRLVHAAPHKGVAIFAADSRFGAVTGAFRLAGA